MGFFRIWNELSPWSKLGLAFVGAVFVILVLLAII